MTYLREALSAPEFYFKRLGQAKPVYRGRDFGIGRTHSTFEAEIEWNNRHYMLYVPFKRGYIEHIEQLECISQERSRGPLIENRIMYDELVTIDESGRRCYYNIVLQEKPSGTMLKEAVLLYKAADLRQAICKMKAHLDAIGFLHNNLTPSNIIICKSGVARPLRYWYAEWEIFSDNDISQLLDFIDKHYSPNGDLAKSPLFVATEEDMDSATPKQHEGITLRCKGGRYGFIDSDNRRITQYTYNWATDFHEGRAIVSKYNKVGVINNHGAKVIPVAYDSIEFDIDTGLFTAIKGNYKYTINYDGSIVCREKFEGGGFLIAKNCNQK